MCMNTPTALWNQVPVNKRRLYVKIIWVILKFHPGLLENDLLIIKSNSEIEYNGICSSKSPHRRSMTRWDNTRCTTNTKLTIFQRCDLKKLSKWRIENMKHLKNFNVMETVGHFSRISVLVINCLLLKLNFDQQNKLHGFDIFLQVLLKNDF